MVYPRVTSGKGLSVSLTWESFNPYLLNKSRFWQSCQNANSILVWAQNQHKGMNHEAMEMSFYLWSLHVKKDIDKRARAKENNQGDQGLGN